jgi:hypothetical protein
MKYIIASLLFSLCLLGKASNDTIYVDNVSDYRYQRYLDSLEAYNISYSVAKNMADTVAKLMGNHNLDDYFFGRFSYESDTQSHGYFYFFEVGARIDVGHVSDTYRGMKIEDKFPWPYLEQQYKRLDSIRIQPWGVMQGGELPNVYIYRKPIIVVIHKKIKRFTMIDYTVQFERKGDGKTVESYIRKYYYSEYDKGRPRIDSIERLDPVTLKHIFR